MAEPPFDVQRAHRWFAVELNNLSWDLVEANQRSASDTQRMIHAAHAAYFHWLQVGQVLNHLRALCLLATAYTKAGLADGAVRYASECVALSDEAGDAQTAFDRAAVHGCASSAFHLAGRREEATLHYRLAISAANRLEDPSERSLFDRLYPARLDEPRDLK